MEQLMEGITLTLEKQIDVAGGNLYHAIKKSSQGFVSFGEAYFSFINKNAIKAWKKHHEMTLNLTVPIGKVKFVFFDDRKNSKTFNQYCELNIGEGNYKRLTVAPGIWFGFMGLADQPSLILNVASIEHNPDEVERKNLGEINYDWT